MALEPGGLGGPGAENGVMRGQPEAVRTGLVEVHPGGSTCRPECLGQRRLFSAGTVLSSNVRTKNIGGVPAVPCRWLGSDATG